LILEDVELGRLGAEEDLVAEWLAVHLPLGQFIEYFLNGNTFDPAELAFEKRVVYSLRRYRPHWPSRRRTVNYTRLLRRHIAVNFLLRAAT